MHDIIGSGGMLRGWAAVWSMYMMWLLAGVTVSVGCVALVELLVAGRRQHAVDEVPLGPIRIAGGQDRPFI